MSQSWNRSDLGDRLRDARDESREYLESSGQALWNRAGDVVHLGNRAGNLMSNEIRAYPLSAMLVTFGVGVMVGLLAGVQQRGGR